MNNFRATSMRHVGMTEQSIRDIVKKKLAIGQQYRIRTVRTRIDEKDELVRAKCVDISTHVVTFKHRDGTRESFTYWTIWQQMLSGDFG